MFLYIGGLWHALTASIQCSLNAKVQLINNTYDQAPKSKVAGVQWWDKPLNYSGSPVRVAWDMCHCSHKNYIYRKGMAGKCMDTVTLRLYLYPNKCSLLKDEWINHVWSITTLEAFFQHLYNQNDASFCFLMSHKWLIDTNLTTLLRDSELNYTHQ